MPHKIEVTQDILDLDLDPSDSCGCFLHRAISGDFPSTGTDVTVGFYSIGILGRYYEVSRELRTWQRDAMVYFTDNAEGWHDAPEPITIVVDESNRRIYIEGE